MSRMYEPPLFIVMQTDITGSPKQFTWKKRHHIVAGVANRWLIDVEWWKQPFTREYLKLYTHSSLLVIVYHDLTQYNWYLLRVYD